MLCPHTKCLWELEILRVTPSSVSGTDMLILRQERSKGDKEKKTAPRSVTFRERKPRELGKSFLHETF